MSVRLRKWKDPNGRVREAWAVDIVFEHADGRTERVRKAAPVNTRRGAEQYERDVRAAMLAGTFGKEAKEAPTLGGFKDRFLTYSETNNKPSSVEAKRQILANHLEPSFGTVRLDAIGLPEIERFKAEKLRAGLSPKTVNCQLGVLRKLLNLAVEWGELSHAPRLRQLKVPPQPFEFLTFEESDRFLTAAETEWAAMLTTAVKTGLRIGELLALRWEDVDLTAGRIVVRRTVWQGQEGTPKGGHAREVPLSRVAAATLKAHRHLRGAYVFCKADGAAFSHSEVKSVVPRQCRRAGLPKRLTWHDLRHTFASHLVMRGRSLKEVQELLGHAAIQMTMRYAHLSPDVKRDAVNTLDEGPGAVAAAAH